MSRLVGGDEFEIDKELLVKAKIEEVLLLEARESRFVKGILEMFELPGKSARRAREDLDQMQTYRQCELQNRNVDLGESSCAFGEVHRVGQGQPGEESAERRESECFHLELMG